MQFSAQQYREGAIERLADAHILLAGRRWAGAAYLAGRSAEAMLRALVRGVTPNDTSGHDLRDLWQRSIALNLISTQEQNRLYDHVNRLAAVWRNNLRYATDDRLLRHLKDLGLDRRLKGNPVEYWARRLVESAEMILMRGELIWIRSQKK